jgi:hypothetical protein
VVGELARRLQSQARLPTAAGAGQREQPNVVAPQEIGHVAELGLSPEKRRRGYRQIGVGKGLQRWEGSVAELVEPLRRGEILQPVSSEITDFDVDEARVGALSRTCPPCATAAIRAA